MPENCARPRIPPDTVLPSTQPPLVARLYRSARPRIHLWSLPSKAVYHGKRIVNDFPLASAHGQPLHGGRDDHPEIPRVVADGSGRRPCQGGRAAGACLSPFANDRTGTSFGRSGDDGRARRSLAEGAAGACGGPGRQRRVRRGRSCARWQTTRSRLPAVSLRFRRPSRTAISSISSPTADAACSGRSHRVPSLSAGVCAAIAEVGNEIAVCDLLDNPGAGIAPISLAPDRRAVRRRRGSPGASPRTAGPAVRRAPRPDLPGQRGAFELCLRDGNRRCRPCAPRDAGGLPERHTATGRKACRMPNFRRSSSTCASPAG